MKRHRKLVVALLVLAALGAAAAVAAWLVTTNNGSGRAKVGNLVSPTLTDPGSYTGPGDLYPGGSGDVRVQVTNPNNTPLVLVSFGSDGSVTFGPQDGTLCPASNFSLLSGTTAVPATVPANAVNFDMTLKNAIQLSSSAPSECQAMGVGVINGIHVDWTTP